MEKKGKVLAAIFIVAVLLGAGLWAVISSNDEEDIPVTLTDAKGRSVTIEKAPHSIVSVSPALTEMVYAFGSGEDLVGVTNYCDFPSDVTERVENGDLETVGGFFYGIDVEKIILLAPDVVFLEESVSEQISMIPKLEQAEITVVVMFTCYNSTLIKDNIEIMGKALHKEDKAESLIVTMDNKFEAIRSKVENSEDRPRIMLVIWWDESSIWVSGGGSFVDEIIERAGAVNAFEEKEAWAMVTREDVVAADPDIIILAAMSMGDVNTALSVLKSDALMAGLPAVVSDEIYSIFGQSDNIFMRQSIRMVDATYICARIAHPDLFDGKVPKELGDDYSEYLPITWAD
ncbi:MAG: ABC transporter substrate-binding protein [Methanomassiliicoccales archaeon]|nr:MAG: ABC transporter substrate-binding protein [Methanomassiliicoccales archaeon]